MRRTRYLLAYDIREDRRLRAIHAIAKSFGYPLQYSVFICDLDPREKYMLKSDLTETMDFRVDSVIMIDLGDPSTRGQDCFEFLGYGNRDDLPGSGPVIL